MPLIVYRLLTEILKHSLFLHCQQSHLTSECKRDEDSSNFCSPFNRRDKAAQMDVSGMALVHDLSPVSVVHIGDGWRELSLYPPLS